MPTAPPIKVPILGVDLYSKEFKQMTKRAQKMGRAVEGVGRKMSMYITAPVIAGGLASMKFAKDLNESLANVGTLIPGQTKKLQGMKTAVQDLSVETGVAATTISEGLYETISAFGDAANPIKKLDIATRMSVAGISTVKEALSLVSAVTKGYGDTSDASAQQVADFAFKTVKLGQTTFPELAASMGKVVPLATTLGQRQKELWAIMATGTGVTGGAAEVTTQLASAYGAFIKPSADMTKNAKKLGFESSITMIKELGLVESLKKLSEATGGSEIEMGKLMTRKEGLNLALTLLGPQADTFTKKLALMGDVAGSTEEAFKQQTDGINRDGHEWEKTKRRVERAAVALGDKLLPVVSKLTDKLIPFIDKVASASEADLEFGIKAAAAAAALSPLLIGVGKAIQVYPLYAAKLGLVTMATTASTTATGKNTIAMNAANMTFKQSIKQAGLLTSGLSLLGAAGVGWTIGSTIYDQLIEPLLKAKHEAKKLKRFLDDIGEDPGMYAGTVLEKGISEYDKKIEKAESRLTKIYAKGPGESAEANLLRDELKKSKEKRRALFIQLNKNRYGGADDDPFTQAQVSQKVTDYEEDWMSQSFSGNRLPRTPLRYDAPLDIATGKSESEIVIKFEGLPSGVTANVSSQKGPKPKVKGPIMDGGGV